MYENRIMKLIKNCKNKKGGRLERVIERVNKAKVYYIHVWNYHNETSNKGTIDTTEFHLQKIIK
jgi:hypothetical protein